MCESSERSEDTFDSTSCVSVEIVVSLISRSKCSTPISSASKAPISEARCLKVHCTVEASELVSSTATYASDGSWSCFTSTSMITNTGSLAAPWPQSRNRWLIWMSIGLILGPVLYQPTIFSFAATFLNIRDIFSR